MFAKIPPNIAISPQNTGLMIMPLIFGSMLGATRIPHEKRIQPTTILRCPRTNDVFNMLSPKNDETVSMIILLSSYP